MIRKSSILITGAVGEVGSELIKSFSNLENINIITIDLNPLSDDLSKRVNRHIVGNILDHNLIDQINLELEIKEIYHLAAVLSTGAESAPKKAHDVNVNGSLNFLELAIKQTRSQNQPVKFFFPSSIAVYGLNEKDVKCNENQCLNPITIYGSNKLYIEKLGLYYSKYYEQISNNSQLVDFRSLRFPGLISAKTTPSGGTSDFIPEMWHNISNNNHYECYVHADARLPFIAMSDAITGIEKLMKINSEDFKQTDPRIYNVTSFNPSAKEFYDLLKVYYKDATITYKINMMRQRIVNSWPSNIDDTVARKDWGWNPKYDLTNVINDYLIEGNKTLNDNY